MPRETSNTTEPQCIPGLSDLFSSTKLKVTSNSPETRFCQSNGHFVGTSEVVKLFWHSSNTWTYMKAPVKQIASSQ